MPKADLDNARDNYPSLKMGVDEWVEFFDGPGGREAMGRILYDIYDQVKEDEEREMGQRRVGRRPIRPPVSLEEVYATIFPQEPSQEPFIPTMRRLLGSTSQRSFASKLGISPQHFGRYLDGKLKPDIYFLERVSTALKIHPSHFLEWRALYIGDVVTKVYTAKPNLSLHGYKAIMLGRKNRLVQGQR